MVMAENNKIRARFAPSPTGLFHIGSARTALFNYLFAKKNKGSFILRIEDTDKERSEKKFEKDIMDGLKWLGLNWDESYYQSERVKTYEGYLKKLLDEGRAYKKEIIWFKNPNKQVVFHDLIRGRVEVDSSVLGDFSLAKDPKTPLYNFAAVIDDHEMQISHVIRGEDHITNTPKQILVYEALGWKPPQFAHLPLILGPDRSKLSKRHGATSLNEYKDLGYLPEAVVNFLALIGWSAQGGSASGGNPTNEEIFSLEELIQKFSLEKIQKGGAIFNIEKLNWFNSHYIKQLKLDELTEFCIPYLIEEDLIKPDFKTEQYPPAYGGYNLKQKYFIGKSKEEISFEKLKNIIGLEQERIKILSEIGEMTKFFFIEPKYKPSLLMWKETKKQEIIKSLETLSSILCDVKSVDFTAGKLKEILMPEAEKCLSADGKTDRGRLLWPLRAALSGREKSPGPFEIAEILGKEKTLKRMEQAKKLLKK
jgi:nondiscriminating glutamyl-tRNA synthetase